MFALLPLSGEPVFLELEQPVTSPGSFLGGLGHLPSLPGATTCTSPVLDANPLALCQRRQETLPVLDHKRKLDPVVAAYLIQSGSTADA